MTASSRGSRVACSILRARNTCPQCLQPSRRSYSSAATALKIEDEALNSTLQHISIPPVTAAANEYKNKAGVLLTRPPLITAPLSPFEKSFFFYQKRLNERLVMPFTRYFYIKKDTPADVDWKMKVKERGGAYQRELGGYTGYGQENWNDELLLLNPGEETAGKLGIAETKFLMDSLVKDSKVRAVEGKDGTAVAVEETAELANDEVEIQKPLSRFTEADKTKDVHRLDRSLARTLYLLVQRENGGWGFPSAELVGKENLHQAAERVIVQTGGVNMNTWIIGNAPVGHHIIHPRKDPADPSNDVEGARTFFMKARIMAGQCNLDKTTLGYKDFKWLSRQEVKRHVSPRYYGWVKNMLADR